MTFFIPLGNGSEHDNFELRYMLRSLEVNFNLPFEIILSIEEQAPVPDWLTNCKLLNRVRYYPQRLDQHFNGYRKFENYFATLGALYDFVHSEVCPDEFIYAYDDQLLIQQISDTTSLFNVAHCVDKKWHHREREGTRHGDTLNSAIELIRSIHHTDLVYNYETHLPRLYEKSKLIELFDRFNFKETDTPYALATVYWNYFYDRPTIILSEGNKIKAGFYFDDDGVASFWNDSVKQIKEVCADKIWVNYNDKALNYFRPKDKIYPLRVFIETSFPNNSTYEK